MEKQSSQEISRAAGSSGASESSSLDKLAQNPDPLQGDVWDRASALKRVRGKIDRLDYLVGLYLDDMPGRVNKLGRAVAEGNFETVIELAHAVKGVSGNIGGLQLYQYSSQLELAAREKNAQLDSLFAELAAAHGILCKTLREHLKS